MIYDSNPYASPGKVTDVGTRSAIINGVETYAVCIRRSWLGREFKLSGGLDAVIRYKAAGSGEKVFVNDQFVAKSTPWHLSAVAPQIDFEIESGDVVFPATIRVHSAWLQLFRIDRFSLTVNGKLLYLET